MDLLTCNPYHGLIFWIKHLVTVTSMATSAMRSLQLNMFPKYVLMESS